MTHSYSLPRSTPEQQGISSAALSRFLDAVQERGIELHSFMALRHGHVIAEGWWAPYRKDLPHTMFSLSKSFTSTAIGLAAYEGLLSLDDQVISFFPDETPDTVSDHLAAMSIRHLLIMGSGHHQDPLASLNRTHGENWIKVFLHAPVEHAPGTHFTYNSGATYIAGAILQKLTGGSLLDFLQPRILEPLGIENATWEKCPLGFDCGGWGLSVKTEDIAKFGQLYLQKGLWQDKQLIPASWVEEATSKQISNGDDPNNDWNQGYGYQFWRCRHGVYRGDGAFGQFCIVMPQYDAVIAITSGAMQLDGVLNVVWDVLLPAFQQPVSPIDSDSEASDALQDKLKSLSLEPPVYECESPLAQEWSGLTYQLEENKLGFNTLSFTLESGSITVTIQNAAGEHQTVYGSNGWNVGSTSLLRGVTETVAASATWKEDNLLLLTHQLVETPFCLSMALTFEEDGLQMSISQNVGFDSMESSVIKGVALAGTKDV
ncbi:CubicO group peptidase, beta-lactamase class C family [Paenibacillus uliginis N3/975]|uniref:CubicO group peptidase, beta-lactamase class C family n=1 Tax=Paenibacillus uliginis N3/975 TaxID=1313296 RepID=A0A1X7GTB9_9BACL|nr:serine hydrolase [Paenibacillus uliginis]SMF74401.1 CubicO group peptidase, beta-lactamase class C family [Paenibacillus uliginis N3/975]